MSDVRAEIYADLHGKELKPDEATNRHSANRILGILDRYLRPQSVLDVGCGIGTWLSVLKARGVSDLAGIDGPWLKPQDAVCDPSILKVTDLEASFDLGRRFDLVVCLEVAEHLSAQAAERFVESLTRHAPAILFSAAIPFQGGHHHVNEQFLIYWEKLFATHRYRPLDIIRGPIWYEQDVHFWLRQNIVLFAHQDLIESNAPLKDVSKRNTPIAVVHPELYTVRMLRLLKQLEELKQLKEFLRQGGTFRSDVNGQEELKLTKLSA
jgi:SAM-dependent methyltransferase